MTDLYVPESFRARQAQADRAMLYDLYDVYKADTGVGAGFGDSVVLGPAGMLAGAMREKGGNRTADKALYKYLYQRHPFVYACVELICQTAAQDRHTYPQSDAPSEYAHTVTPGLQGTTKQGKLKKTPKTKLQPAPRNKDTREDDGDEGDFGSMEPDDGMEFLEHFFAEVNPYESFNEMLQSVYRDLLIFGEAFILKQREGATVKDGNLPRTNAGRGAGDGADGDRELAASSAATGGRVTHVSQDPTARVGNLYRIPSRDTFAVPADDGYPYCYRQKADGGGYREYAAVDVIFVRMPDPDDPCRGLAPLEALDMSMATDMSAAKYNEAYFRNGAKAGMIVSGQGLSEHEVRRNKQWLSDEYCKAENAHKPLLLLGNIELVRDGDKAANDMEFLNLRKFTREEICAVFSVPMSKLLHTSDGMGSTGKATDDMTFRADTVGPLQTKVYEAINRQLMKPDFKGLPLLIPPRQEKVRLDLLEAAKSLVQIGGTGNEARAIVHLPMVEHPTMDVPLFLVPGLKSLITDDAAQAAANGDGEPLKSGSPTNAQRPDRTSSRTSNGQKNARAKGGTGMKVRKAEEVTSTEGDDLLEGL